MNDKFTNGFIAGLVGGTATAIVGLIAYLFKSTLSFVDISGIIVFGRIPNSFIEYIVALFIQLGFSAFFGIAFAYLIPVLSWKNYLVKGWFYGMVIWFVIYGVMSLFQIKGLTNVPVQTVISNIIGASFFGITMTMTYKVLFGMGKIGPETKL